MKLTKAVIIGMALIISCSGLASATQDKSQVNDHSEKTTSQKVVLKLFKMDCSACSAQIEAKLYSLDGISEAVADYEKAEAYVIFNPVKISVNKMISEIKAIEFDAKEGDIKTFPAEGLKTVKSAKDGEKLAALQKIEKEDEKLGIKIVSTGEVIDLEKDLDKNKLTIYDFYADWCDHCVILGENLKTLLQKNPESFVVKKIHLKGEAKDTFNLPIVKKYMKDVYGFPYIRIYNPKGVLLYEGGEFVQIEQVLKKNSGKA
jgi:thiol-disulfide isomerase/thioredoxin